MIDWDHPCDLQSHNLRVPGFQVNLAPMPLIVLMPQQRCWSVSLEVSSHCGTSGSWKFQRIIVNRGNTSSLRRVR